MHYPGRHIREWHQGVMSSRELAVLIAGFPDSSWFKVVARRDFQKAIDVADGQELQNVKQMTEALLRGEVVSRADQA